VGQLSLAKGGDGDKALVFGRFFLGPFMLAISRS